MAKSVLVVSGEGSHRDTLASLVSHCGLLPKVSSTAAGAKYLLARWDYAAVLCDDQLPDGDFRSVLSEADGRAGHIPVIVVSRRADWDSYIVALAGGATDYVAFPPYPGEVEHSLRNALKLSRSLAAIESRSAVPTPL